MRSGGWRTHGVTTVETKVRIAKEGFDVFIFIYSKSTSCKQECHLHKQSARTPTIV